MCSKEIEHILYYKGIQQIPADYYGSSLLLLTILEKKWSTKVESAFKEAE